MSNNFSRNQQSDSCKTNEFHSPVRAKSDVVKCVVMTIRIKDKSSNCEVLEAKTKLPHASSHTCKNSISHL